MSKYTVNAGERFDLVVDQHLCRIVARCLKSKYSQEIKAIVLMGSYGRGEGTAFQGENGLQPFNDYDLVVVGASMNEWKRRKIQKEFHRLEIELSAEIGIDVDLFLHTENSLKRADASLMNYEMKYGHKVVYGDESILDIMPEYSSVDLSEATRLLLNRGKLLLDISRSLQKNEVKDELKFKKFLNKVVLAMGDAALMAAGFQGIYYKNKLEQIEQITGFQNSEWLIEEYQSAIAFKFIGDVELLPRDIESYYEELKEKFLDFYYDFESVRLKKDVHEYHQYFDEISQEHTNSSWKKYLRHFYLNLRGFGLSNLDNMNWLGRHPRERLFAIFPLLIKSQLSFNESRLVSRLQACDQNQDICQQKFYQLREKYL
jgi:predicted nucleotidyltransferase